MTDDLASEMKACPWHSHHKADCDFCRVASGLKTPLRTPATGEVERLRLALKPFAAMTFEGTVWENPRHVDDPVLYNHATGARVAIEDFERARQALTPQEGCTEEEG